MNAEVETLLEPVENIADWWPGGVVSAPSDTFLDDFQDTGSDLDLDLDLDLEMESDNSDLDLSGQFNDLPDVAPDLQLAYDADSEEAAVESLADNDDEAMAEENQPMSQDEIGTKLDLARAYIDMGDVDGAREILDEVLNEGSDDQRDQAASMLKLIA
jgi:pilus assembly protein FimV